VVADLYKGDKAARIVSLLCMVIAFSPACGPIIGSKIAAYSNWRVCFVIISTSSAILLFCVQLFFQETLLVKNKNPLSLNGLFCNYMKLFSNKTFVKYAAIQNLTIAWLWSDIANLPFIFVQSMGLNIEVYGYYIVINVIIYVFGTIINQKYVEIWGG